MTDRRLRQPLPSRKVAAGGVVALLLLAGIILLGETLRHPLPGAPPGEPLVEPEADPRTEISCPSRERAAAPGGGALVAAPEEPVAVTSNEVLDCPRTFDGRRVRYEGEVVGAVLPRSEGAWLQLNDDVYAGDLGPLPAHRDYRGGNAGLGVFVPRELAADIAHVGGPQSRGDRVAVVGVFHRVDPATHEIAVIRADRGSIIGPGGAFRDEPLRDRQVVAVVLAVVAAGFVAVERYATRRRGRG